MWVSLYDLFLCLNVSLVLFCFVSFFTNIHTKEFQWKCGVSMVELVHIAKWNWNAFLCDVRVSEVFQVSAIRACIFSAPKLSDSFTRRLVVQCSEKFDHNRCGTKNCGNSVKQPVQHMRFVASFLTSKTVDTQFLWIKAKSPRRKSRVAMQKENERTKIGWRVRMGMFVYMYECECTFPS